MFKRAAISLTTIADEGSAEFDLQYGTVPDYPFYATPAPPNTPAKDLSIIHGLDEASPAPRDTPYLDIPSPSWPSLQPQSGSPLALRFTVPETDDRPIDPSTPTPAPGSRSEVCRPSRKVAQAHPPKKTYMEEI